MNLKKFFIIISAFFILIIIGGFFLVDGWRSTPYGKLDPRVAIYLKLTGAAEKSIKERDLPVSESRRMLAEKSASVSGTPVQMASVKDMKAVSDGYEIPVRIYTPEGTAPYPAVVFYHGGGWVQGSIDTHDGLCRIIAKKSGAVVISVEYRLAPEHKYPAAINDGYSALKWIYSNAESLNIDRKKIAVAGDSAGGNLAASVCLMSRDKKGPAIVFQALIYPGVDSAHLDTQSYKNFGVGYMLDKASVERFIDYYLPDVKDRLNPYASPLLAKDHSLLPPALIITAEFDVLRDEGEAYAKKLKGSGVNARAIRYPGMIHGFVSADGLLNQARQATDEIGSDLKMAFSAK